MDPGFHRDDEIKGRDDRRGSVARIRLLSFKVGYDTGFKVFYECRDWDGGT